MKVNTTNQEGICIASVESAGESAASLVINADPESPDGRSQWLWVRLINGDLLLATYPQGDTYFDIESELFV